MKNDNNYRSGGSRGGNRRPSGGFQKNNELFKATCAQCGDGCQVPFKPNGRKPVLCSLCFKKGGDKPYSQGRSDQPKRYQKRDSAPRFPQKDPLVQKELASIQRKLDYIIKILESVEIIEETEE